MPNHELFARCDRFLTLMNQAEDAIGRRDLDSVGTLQQQVAVLTTEMESLFHSAANDPTVHSSMVQLELPLRRALERVTQNQVNVTRWLEEIGAQLTRLNQGAVAVRGYSASVPLGSSLFERQA